MKANQKKTASFDEFELMVVQELASRPGFISGLKEIKLEESHDTSPIKEAYIEEIAEKKAVLKTPGRLPIKQQEKTVKAREPLVEKTAKTSQNTSKFPVFESSDMANLKKLEKEAKRVSLF